MTEAAAGVPAPSAPPRRVKTPTVLQMEAVECGAAALGIVLAHYGRLVPLEELRLACGVSRDGSKASNVAKAARTYGLGVRAFRKETEELKRLPVPMIVFWNFNHFVVVEGFRKGRWYLNDPAYGPRTVSEAEFDGAFTGVVLTFEVGPEFTRGGQFPSLFTGLRSRLVGSKAALVYVFLAGLALVPPGLAIPSFTKVFIDNVLVGGLMEWLPLLLAGIGMTLVLMAALTGLQLLVLLHLGDRITLTASSKFFWHILHLPAEFFTVRYAGDVASRVGLNAEVARFLASQLGLNLVSLAMIVFYALIMVQYSVLLTVVGVTITLLNLVALQYVSRKRVDVSQRLQQDTGKLMSTSFNGLQMIETLKATGGESDFFSRWAGYQAKSLNAKQELGAYTYYVTVVPVLLAAVTTAIILAVGGGLVIAGAITIGALVAFQYLMSAFSQPVNDLVSLGSEVQEMQASMARVDDVLRYRTDPALDEYIQEGNGSNGTVRLSGRLELRNVTFGYSRLDPPLIENLSITLEPGARVALVGGSGSGKSTVARLVCGLYQPWSGEILFDGRPRSALQRSALTSSMGLVDQDIFLFEGTVRENLTLWDSTVSEQQVVGAARDACIHDDVAERHGSYESHVAEGGGNFSGGQRQRLEIARALVGDPTLLVLDEATSALDPTTEKRIDDRLRRRGCTCLIVAHRLSTIRDCDEIIVLDHGKVVQRGTHDSLRAQEGPYAALIAEE